MIVDIHEHDGSDAGFPGEVSECLAKGVRTDRAGNAAGDGGIAYDAVCLHAGQRFPATAVKKILRGSTPGSG